MIEHKIIRPIHSPRDKRNPDQAIVDALNTESKNGWQAVCVMPDYGILLSRNED